MKKKLLLTALFVSLAFGVIGTDSASALVKNSDDIPERTYVIGTHQISADEALTTPKIMLAATTLPEGSTLDDMVIYYKKADSTWVDSARGDDTSSPEVEFPITGVNIEYVDFVDTVDVGTRKEEAKAKLQAKHDFLYKPAIYSAAKLVDLGTDKDNGDTAIDAATTHEEVAAALKTAIEILENITPSAIRNITQELAYDDLDDAVGDASDGDDLKLANNLGHTTGRVNIDKTLTLDLAGFMIVDNSPLNGQATRATFVVAAGGTFTVDDSSDGKTGIVDTPVAEGSPYAFNFRNQGGSLIIKGGTFNASNSVFMARGFEGSNTSITGGTFNGVISNNGRSTAENALTISGGTFNKILYLPAANTTTTISGGTFNMIPDEVDNNAAIVIKAGTLNISGGTFSFIADTSSNIDHLDDENDGSGKFLGVIVAVKSTGANRTNSYAGPLAVNITGGTFTNEGNDVIVIANHSAKKVPDGQGGTTDNFSITAIIDAEATINGNISVYDLEDNPETPEDEGSIPSIITGTHHLIPQP